MKKVITPLILVLAILPFIKMDAQSFIPIDPVEWIVDDEGAAFLEEASQDDILNLLPNEAVNMNIGLVQDDGAIKYTSATLTEKGQIYIVTMDYFRYKSEVIDSKKTASIDGSSQGSGKSYVKVGIGLRLTARITAKDKDVDLGSLFSIAAGVQEGKISGSINVDIIGIKNKDVTITVPIPGILNQTSIQNAMGALATVKSKMYDVDAILTPQVIAVKAKDTESADEIIGSYFESGSEKTWLVRRGHKKKNSDSEGLAIKD